MKRIRGFTLMELLVVISIIALLMAILMPALMRVRESAMNVKCLANMRNIAIALATYAADNNGRLPYGNTAVAFYDQQFQPALATYLGISRSDPEWERKKWWSDVHPAAMAKPFREAIYCPTGYKKGYSSANGQFGSYGCLYGTGGLQPLFNGTELPALASRMSNRVFVIGEGGFNIYSPIDDPFGLDRSGNGVPDTAAAWFSLYSDYNNAEPMRHPGGGGHANYSFADGSARSVSFNDWESGHGLWRR